MTFTTIKTAIKDYCLLSSTDADTRVGAAINRHYRRITASLGLDATRFVSRTVSMTTGQRAVTFTEIEKIDRIFDTTDSTAIRKLDEVSIDTLRSEQPGTAAPLKWALQNTDADSVVVLTDTIPQTAWDLQADGWTTLADLSGSDEPVFPESYHDILTFFVISEELLKKEKFDGADRYEKKAKDLLNDLRFFLADSHTKDTRQGGRGASSSIGSASGGGSASVGGTAYTQTALLTFNRGSALAPFAVLPSDATYVANLGAEFLGNITTDRLIGRDTAGTGESEFITVGGGLEFTGSGGIQRSALTGHVVASAGSAATTIANDVVSDAMLRNSAALSVIGRSANTTGDPADIAAASDGDVLRRSGTTLGFGAIATAGITDDAVTYAKIQNISAASRVLGRGSASGAGNTEELTLGSGLQLVGTAIGPTTFKCQGRLTLTTGVPVTTADVTAAGTIYFTPYLGNRVSLYDGSAWAEYAFTERSLALTLTSGSNYDVFLYNNAGTLTLELSAAWTNASTRSAALTTQDGVPVKSGATTRLHLGTIWASGTNTAEDSYLKRRVWNRYNQVARPMKRWEDTNSWTYTTATWQQANAAAANQLDFVVGDITHAVVSEVHAHSTNSGTTASRNVGIGHNWTSGAPSSRIDQGGLTSAGSEWVQHHVTFATLPTLGQNTLVWLEQSTAAGTTTWYGDNNTPTVVQSGIEGVVMA